MGTYQLTETDGIQTLAVVGDTGAEEAVQILQTVARDVKPGGPLLIDIREARSQTLSFKDTYQIATLLGSLSDAFQGRIAVLDGFDDQFEKTQFFEASAAVKGMEVRAFIGEPEALRWLQDTPQTG